MHWLQRCSTLFAATTWQLVGEWNMCFFLVAGICCVCSLHVSAPLGSSASISPNPNILSVTINALPVLLLLYSRQKTDATEF